MPEDVTEAAGLQRIISGLPEGKMQKQAEDFVRHYTSGKLMLPASMYKSLSMAIMAFQSTGELSFPGGEAPQPLPPAGATRARPPAGEVGLEGVVGGAGGHGSIEMPARQGASFAFTPVKAAGYYTESGVESSQLSFSDFQQFTRDLLQEHGIGKGGERLPDTYDEKIKAMLADVKSKRKSFAEAVSAHMPDMAWDVAEDEAPAAKPGAEAAPGADAAAEAPAGAAPEEVKYKLTDGTFKEIMQNVALLPGVSPLEEVDRMQREKNCNSLFRGFRKAGRTEMTAAEREQFVQFSLEMAGGAAPNVAVQKYSLLVPVAVAADIVRGDPTSTQAMRSENSYNRNEFIAEAGKRLRETNPGEEINDSWIQFAVDPLLLSFPGSDQIDTLYFEHQLDELIPQLHAMVKGGLHKVPVPEQYAPIAGATLAGFVSMGAGGAPGGEPIGPVASEAAAAPEPETRTPMKLEDAIERARTSYFFRIDSSRFVEYLKAEEKKKGLVAWAYGGIAGLLGKLKKKEPEPQLISKEDQAVEDMLAEFEGKGKKGDDAKKEGKKPEEPSKKRLTERRVDSLSRDYVVDVIEKSKVPQNTVGSDVYVTLEDVMRAFDDEVKGVEEYQRSNEARDERNKKQREYIDSEEMTIVRLPEDHSRILALIESTGDITGKGMLNERKNVERTFNEVKDNLDYETIMLLLNYAIQVKHYRMAWSEELAEKVKAARKSRGEKPKEEKLPGRFGMAWRRMFGEKRKKTKAEKEEEKPYVPLYKLPGDMVPEGCVATIGELFAPLALKYIAEDGSPETPENMKKGFETYSVIPRADLVLNDDGTIAGVAFSIDENYNHYNQTVIDKNPDGNREVFPSAAGTEAIMKTDDAVDDIVGRLSEDKDLSKDHQAFVGAPEGRKFVSTLVNMYAEAVAVAQLNFTNPESKPDWVAILQQGRPAYIKAIMGGAIIDIYKAGLQPAEAEAPVEEEAVIVAAGGAPPPKGTRLVRVSRTEINEAGYNILTDPVGDAQGRSMIEEIVGKALETGRTGFIPVESSDNVYEVNEGSKPAELKAVAAMCKHEYSGKGKKTQMLPVAEEPPEIPEQFRNKKIPVDDTAALIRVVNDQFGTYPTEEEKARDPGKTGAIDIAQVLQLAEDNQLYVVEEGRKCVDSEGLYTAALGVSKWFRREEEANRLQNRISEVEDERRQAEEMLYDFIGDPNNTEHWKRVAGMLRCQYTNDEEYRRKVADAKGVMDVLEAYMSKQSDEINDLQEKLVVIGTKAVHHDEMRNKLSSAEKENERLRQEIGDARSDKRYSYKDLELARQGKDAWKKVALSGGIRHTRKRGILRPLFWTAAAAAVVAAVVQWGRPMYDDYIKDYMEDYREGNRVAAAKTIEGLRGVRSEAENVLASYDKAIAEFDKAVNPD